MTSDNDARVWLRANGYADIADVIDGIMEGWRKRQLATRRNWWDVLAGSLDGEARTVAGIAFPLLAAARRRKGWGTAASEISRPSERTQPPKLGDLGTTIHPKKVIAGNEHRLSASRKKAAVVVQKATPELASVRTPTSEGTKKDTHLTLTVQGFAQLKSVTVPMTDLLVLVGPQATGKSLVLELLKLAIDRNRIVRSLKQHGFKWEKPQDFSSLYFGGGFERSWDENTSILFGNESVTLEGVSKARGYQGEDAVFYIPAHRTLAIADGWPRPFAQYQVETPYVARRFSEELLTALNQGMVGKGKIFPHDRRLKDAFRRLIDDAVFHGAALKLDTLGMRKQFILEYGDGQARLPYMAWTAGQREFTPLLLGLYHLLPAGGGPKKREVRWAIIEEPEMGLHPKAVVAVMAVVLDLLARGYKVALSTHSPTVLEVIWGMSRLKGTQSGPTRLCRMMGLPTNEKSVLTTAAEALKKTSSVVHLQHDTDGRVVSADISNLNPGAADRREWEWGGLTGFSAKVAHEIAESRKEVSKK